MTVATFRNTPAHRTITRLIVLVWTSAAACTASSAPGTSGHAAAASASFGPELAFCVDSLNSLRATKGLAALTRNAELERYAAAAARTDGLAHRAHRHARRTNHGGAIARAENEILWWSLDDYGTVRAIIEGGLSRMWRQGPGGTHYENLVGPYTQAGCGIFVHGAEVTVVTAFR